MPGLMMPVLQIAQDVAGVRAGGAAPAGGGGDFADRIRELLTAAGEDSGKLGAGSGSGEAGKGQALAERLEEIAEMDDQDAAMAAFLLLLKDLAADAAAGPAGGWQVRVDPDGISALAESAGLDETGRAALAALFDADGRGRLLPLLDLLSGHFAKMAAENEVRLPETDLPLLNAIMERFGVEAPEIAGFEEKSLGSDGRFSLETLARLLGRAADGQEAGASRTAELSFWEVRELRALLARAGWEDAGQALTRSVSPGDGISSRTCESVRPETLPGGVSPGDGKAADRTVITFGEFVDLLRQAAAEGRAAMKRRADLPSFAAQLERLLDASGIGTQVRGWSAVAEKSRDEALNRLLETVDLSTVKISRIGSVFREGVQVQEDAFSSAKTTAAASGRAADVIAAEAEARNAEPSSSAGGAGKVLVRVRDAAVRTAEHIRDSLRPDAGVEPPRFTAGVNQAAPAAAQVQSRPAPPVDPVQVMEQLASGISRAVSLHRHHVRIHLQPPELGEVKVDLMVRQDHVSVSFVMEDSRVRDILEANLQQFRDQLASRGFTLAGLDVSVGGRDDDPSGKWRDLLARSFGSGGGRAVPSAAVEPAAVRVPPGGTAGGSGISVMV